MNSSRRACFRELQRGFTLVEVLVVIALVAALIGLLIPALATARQSAQSSACGSNLRQLAIANLTYARDHTERLAPGASDFRLNLNRWHGTRTSVHEAFHPDGGPLSPYLGPDGAVRRCPTFQPDAEAPGDAFEAGAGGYGYNNAYLGVDRDGDDRLGIDPAQARDSERTIMFTDGAYLVVNPERVIEYSFAEPPHARNHPEWLLDASIHFRHSGEAAVVWLDGHVSHRRLDHTRGNIFGASEKEMRRHGLGWFGPGDNRLFDLE